MTDVVSIECGPPDRNGRRVVIASYHSLEWRDRLDTDDAWKRKQFCEAAIAQFGLADDAHAYIDSELIRAADAEDARTESEANHGSTATLATLHTVQPLPVEWLWPGRFAIGKLTLIAGDPGLGKSFLTLDMAARVSKGQSWPDDPSEPQEQGGVVLLSAEDDLADTIRPRLDAHGADVRRIVALTAITYQDELGDVRRGADLTTDLVHVEEAIDAADDCRLVVIDPISAFLGATDSHKNADVRGVLSRLADLAERRRVAVVAVTHLRKGDGAAIYRAMGSLAFVAAARAAWAVVKDKDDPQRRLMLPLKNNLAPDVDGLAYRIEESAYGTPSVSWYADPVTIGVDEAMAPEQRRRGPVPVAADEAEEWLASYLADGPKLASEVYDVGRNGEDHSKRTIDRAKKTIGVDSFRESIPGPWIWRLPESQGRQDPTELKHLGNLGNLGESPGNSDVFNSQKTQHCQGCQDNGDGNQPGDVGEFAPNGRPLERPF